MSNVRKMMELEQRIARLEILVGRMNEKKVSPVTPPPLIPKDQPSKEEVAIAEESVAASDDVPEVVKPSRKHAKKGVS